MAAPCVQGIFFKSMKAIQCLRNHNVIHSRTTATFASKELQTSQLTIQIDKTLQRNIQEKKVAAKNHTGKQVIKRVELPSKLQKSTVVVRETYPIPGLQEHANKFARYIAARKPPIDTNELRKIASDIELDVLNKEKINPLDLKDDERDAFLSKIKNKVLTRLKKTVYHWKPINYNAYKSFLYMASRLAPEYAVMNRVFSEIAKRDPGFKPLSLFDFGSGVGSVTWAANQQWNKWLSQHYSVDSSNDMNTLARLLMQDGEEQKDPCFRGVYFRQFMPSAENKYNVVVSAYSLLDLPNKETRVKTVLSLWEMTEDYLVIVENGSNVGYHLMLEARKYILESIDKGTSEGHVFAPCAHDKMCPRFEDGSGIPCNFSVPYKPLDGADNVKKIERFTYVVFKKGARDKTTTWPRIVRQVLRPSKHVHCRMCLSNGKLGHAILTSKKHGKELYQCARQSEAGDLLPATVDEIQDQHFAKPDETVVDNTSNQDIGTEFNSDSDHQQSNTAVHIDQDIPVGSP